MSEQSRMIWLDCLRLMAGISMLGLHATSDPTGQPWVQYPVEDRYLPLLLRTVLYIARTELFIMISCFLLLLSLDRRPRPYRTVIEEQTRRLLAPFIFWTVFFAGYGLIKAEAFGYYDSALADLFNPQAWVGSLLLGNVKYHMHFLPTLFGIVLLFPLFRLAVKYPALGLTIFGFLLAKHQLDAFVYRTFWGTDILPYLVRMVKIATYVGYGMMAGAAVGIWQRTTPEQRKEWFPLCMFLGLMLFAFKLISTWQTAQTGAWTFNYFPGYWADFLFPMVLFGGCMVLSHLRWPELIAKLAPYSFGIYLCHPIFLDLFEIAMQKGSDLSPIAQIGIKMSFALITSSALVYLISKTKLLAWTIGLGPLPMLSRKPALKQKET